VLGRQIKKARFNFEASLFYLPIQPISHNFFSIEMAQNHFQRYGVSFSFGPKFEI